MSDILLLFPYTIALDGYCTLDELRAAMPDVDGLTAYDNELTYLINRASRVIDSYLHRRPRAFYVVLDEVRYFNGSGNQELWIGELAAAPTSVAVAETGILTAYTTWAATDYYCWPWNALEDGMPYLRLDIDPFNGAQSVWYKYPRSVKVTGKFGFSTTPPEEIIQATIIQVMRWFKRGQQAFQDTGAIVELGQLRYTQQLDPDVKQILSAAKFQRMTI